MSCLHFPDAVKTVLLAYSILCRLMCRMLRKLRVYYVSGAVGTTETKQHTQVVVIVGHCSPRGVECPSAAATLFPPPNPEHAQLFCFRKTNSLAFCLRGKDFLLQSLPLPSIVFEQKRIWRECSLRLQKKKVPR